MNLSFFGPVGLASVAEPSIVEENGIVIASKFDLAGTKATALLDPAAVFLRALVWFGVGTAPDVPDLMERELELAVAGVGPKDILVVVPYSKTILPERSTVDRER